MRARRVSLVAGPSQPLRVGVIAPPDMALDGELRRWSPPGVALLSTRTPYTALPVSVEQAELVGDVIDIQHAVRALAAVAPSGYTYACTSGSFVHGAAGELLLAESMVAAGAPVGLTASGSIVRALRHLGVSAVAVATPYDAHVTARLAGFLGEYGIDVVAVAHLGLSGSIWTVPYSVTASLVRRADSPQAQAVLVSCTNLHTYDLIAALERELGKPVITANQATMWAVLTALGKRAVGPGQRLLAGRGAVPRRPGRPAARRTTFPVPAVS